MSRTMGSKNKNRCEQCVIYERELNRLCSEYAALAKKHSELINKVQKYEKAILDEFIGIYGGD